MEKVKPEKRHVFKRIKKEHVPKIMPPVYEMLIVIINRGHGQDVVDFLNNQNVSFNIASFGFGTANSGIAELLSLYNKEKEVIYSVIKLKDSKQVLDKLESEILRDEKHMGIAFTLPLKSMTNQTMEHFN